MHKITIEIKSEKEWAAVCALSSLLEKPVSEIAKDDVISMTKITAQRVKDNPDLYSATRERNPSQLKMLVEIIK